MNVLLIYPPTPPTVYYRDAHTYRYNGEPVALEYLAAGCMHDGHRCRLLDLRLHPGELEETIAEYHPGVIGITGYTLHVMEMLKLCDTVKKIDTGCKTVIGGHHATVRPEDFFKPQVDFVVCGEGIAPFRRLLQVLASGRKSGEIAGVWSSHDGRFVSGGEQDVYDIDALPFPVRTLNRSDRSLYHMCSSPPVALLRTSEGCSFRCSFCALHRILKGRYLVRGIESVVEELSQIEEPYIFLTDSEPWVKGERMMKLAEAIGKAGITKNYFALCRVDTMINNIQLMKAWKQIGLDCLFMGVESIFQRDLEEYDKKIDLYQVEKALFWAKELGIRVQAQFIIRPHYEKKHFDRITRFIERNNIELPTFTIITPLPGTAALENLDSITELMPDGRPNWAMFDLQHPVTGTTLPKEIFMEEYERLWMLTSPL